MCNETAANLFKRVASNGLQPIETMEEPTMEVGINQAAKITRKNKSTIWRDTKSGVLSSKANGKGQRVYDIAELERVYGQIYDPDAPETNATEVIAVASNQPQPGIEAEKLALKLEFLERELTLVKDQLTEARSDRDHWRTQAETVLRALPAPTVQPTATEEKPGFLARLFGGRR